VKNKLKQKDYQIAHHFVFLDREKKQLLKKVVSGDNETFYTSGKKKEKMTSS
jgi:hypothetical protein